MIKRDPKDIPALFQAPMVRALLDGTKTQTRRLLYVDRLHEGIPPDSFTYLPEHPAPVALHNHSWTLSGWHRVQPDDRLWVRETWRVGKPHDAKRPIDILPPLVPRGKGVTVLYEAGGWRSIGPVDRAEPTYPNDEPMPDWAGKCRPAIHMPRAFSRLTLLVTSVKIERLQDISEDDAIAEGVERLGYDGDAPEYRGRYGYRDYRAGHPHAVVPFCKARTSYASLWSLINGEASWDANPWVVATQFRAIDANIDAPEARVAA